MKKYFYVLLCVLISLNACKKLPNGGIPTYIKLANPTLQTAVDQGATVHGISDLWIESGGKDLGAYEYPIIFPAYLAGENTVTVNAGIFYNGNTSERRIHPALEPFKTTLNFVQEDTILIEPIFKYKSSVNFLYIEDFESTNNFSNIERTTLTDAANITGKAGEISLGAGENFKTSQTISPLQITSGQRVILEFGLKTANYGGFGFKSVSNSANRIQLGSFAPYANWTTSYFELTSFINQVKEGEYQFYIEVERGDLTGESKTYIDNFKIIQF